MMARRRLPIVNGSDGTAWRGPAVQVDTASGRAKLYKTWYSPDGAAWEPQDTLYANYSIELTAEAASSTSINLTWTAVAGATYRLWRGTTNVYDGPNGWAVDSGLAASTTYSYNVDALIGGTVVARDYATVPTPAAPPPTTSSGFQLGPPLISSGEWTSCIARTLAGPSFTFSGYVTSFNLYLGAQPGYTGRFDPFIGSTRLGHRDVTTGKTWTHVDGGNLYASGSIQVGAHLDAGCNYGTAWQEYSGAPFNYNVACGQINYWWYTSREQDDLMRSEPWWDETLAGRDIEKVTRVNADGSAWKVRITDKRTRAVLVDWEDLTRRIDQ